MGLYLNKDERGFLRIERWLGENPIASLTCSEDSGFITYYPEFFSFNPKFDIRKIQIWDSSFKANSKESEKEWFMNATICDNHNLLTLRYSTHHGVGQGYGEYNAESFLVSCFYFIFSFDSVEDLITVCAIKRPTEYKNANELVDDINKICAILNKMNKPNGWLSEWLKVAFYRFNLRLKTIPVQKNGEEQLKSDMTQFAALEPILAKHGYALFKK